MQGCPVEKMPAVWVEALRTQLAGPDDAVAPGDALVAARRIEPLAGDLARIATDASAPPAQRFEAMGALVLVRALTRIVRLARLAAGQGSACARRQQAAAILAQAA